MREIEWIRLNELLVKDYEKFKQDHLNMTVGRTSKIRKLAARNVGFALRRVEYYIGNRDGSRLLLKDYLAGKSYEVEEFFQPNYFLDGMTGFLELVQFTIASFYNTDFDLDLN